MRRSKIRQEAKGRMKAIETEADKLGGLDKLSISRAYKYALDRALVRGEHPTYETLLELEEEIKDEKKCTNCGYKS